MLQEYNDRLLSLSAVMKMLSVASRSTMYNYVKQNPDFPKPFKIAGERGRVKFRAREVAQFIDSLGAGE